MEKTPFRGAERELEVIEATPLRRWGVASITSSFSIGLRPGGIRSIPVPFINQNFQSQLKRQLSVNATTAAFEV
jgi:hypothetical protein